MSKRFLNEVRDFTLSELEDKLENLKKDLHQFRYKSQLGALEKPSCIKSAKRDVARINTLIREKKMQEKKA